MTPDRSIHPETTPAVAEVLPYDVVCAVVRESGATDANRLRKNGKADAAQEVEAAVKNILNDLYYRKLGTVLDTVDPVTTTVYFDQSPVSITPSK